MNKIEAKSQSSFFTKMKDCCTKKKVAAVSIIFIGSITVLFTIFYESQEKCVYREWLEFSERKIEQVSNSNSLSESLKYMRHIESRLWDDEDSEQVISVMKTFVEESGLSNTNTQQYYAIRAILDECRVEIK
jgi:hypothetical protein